LTPLSAREGFIEFCRRENVKTKTWGSWQHMEITPVLPIAGEKNSAILLYTFGIFLGF
jgi:hypothetical protein